MASVRISCAHCGQAFEVGEGQTEVRCPECGKTPGEAAAASALVAPSVSAGAGAAPVPSPPPAISSGHGPPPAMERPKSPPPPPPPPASPAPAGAAAGGGAGASAAQGGSQIGEVAGQVLNYGKELSLTWWARAKRALVKHARNIVVSPPERESLERSGIQIPAVQRHFAWRRSQLWLIVVPTAFSAVMGTITNLAEDYSEMSGFGVFMVVLYTLTLWAIPASAFLAAWWWDRPRRSGHVLLGAFLFAYGFILLVGLLPGHWLIKIEETDPNAVAQAKAIVGAAWGGFMMLWLLPAILSMLPGAIRACVRIKVLFPESIVSGWLLVTLTPVYALILFTLFIFINQLAGSFMLIFGAAFVAAAPLAYIHETRSFIRPLWREEEIKEVEKAQWTYQAILAMGLFWVVLWVLLGQVLGKRIIAWGSADGWVGFWEFVWRALNFAVDYLGRSLFITVIAIDWFLLINLSVWRHMREFEKQEAAKAYEGAIEELGRVLGKD